MIAILAWVALSALSFQIIAALLMQRGLRKVGNAQLEQETGAEPFLSVLIAVKNEESHVRGLLTALGEQEYPNAEFILVDDHSSDRSFEIIDAFVAGKERFKVLQTGEEQRHKLDGKKAALQTAIEAARHPLLVFTDGDCLPNDIHWLRRFARSFATGSEVVVGSGFHRVGDGMISSLYASETIRTALMYHAGIGLGSAYMCVGRSMGYTRQAFERSEGFLAHADLLTGSDDLLLQSFEEGTVIRSCPAALTLSDAPSTWKAWSHQKKRHLGAAPRYPVNISSLLMLYDLSLLLMPLILLWSFWMGVPTMAWVVPLIIVRTVLSASNFQRIINLAGRPEAVIQLWRWEYPASWMNALISIYAIWTKDKAWKRNP
ncbi:MAG: glycosyltransferase [Flavobacteriales bacterium]|nr:glycosyltransferase [Flavobacteriales bacterium]